MKKACPSCGTGKARRLCARHGNVEICSTCCAETRDPDCGDCVHYSAAQDYEIRRAAPGNLPSGQFLVEVSPEIEEGVNRALDLVVKGQRDLAAKALDELNQRYPRNHMVSFGYGTLHAVNNDLEQAIRCFDQAVAAYPYFVEAYFNKAEAHMQMMDIGKAVQAYRKVVAYGDPGEPETIKAGEFIESITASVRKTNGVSLDTYLDSMELFNRAFDLMDTRDWEGARKGFRAAIKKNPANVPSHGNMGLCLGFLGRRAEALASLDRALELDPGYEPALTNRLKVEKLEEGQSLGVENLQTVNLGLGRS